LEFYGIINISVGLKPLKIQIIAEKVVFSSTVTKDNKSF